MQNKKAILETRTDVLMVGAGAAGLALAMERAAQVQQCLIFEQNARPSRRNSAGGPVHGRAGNPVADFCPARLRN